MLRVLISATLILEFGAVTGAVAQTTGASATGTKSPPAATQQATAAPKAAYTPGTPSIDAQRAMVWNSAEMLYARSIVRERFARSKQTKPEDAERYLSALSQLSPDLMNQWLDRFKQRQSLLERQQAVTKQAQQISQGAAVAAQRRTRQSFENINQNRGSAALLATSRFDEQQRSSQDLLQIKTASRDAALIGLRTTVPYTALWGSPSPNGFNTKLEAFAAASNPAAGEGTSPTSGEGAPSVGGGRP